MGNSLKRTAKLAIIAYKDEDGVDAYAQLGEEIRVHSDDVKRFDRLNDQHDSETVVEVEEEPEAPAEPPADDEEPLERPSNKAHLSESHDYPEQEGVELENADGKAKTKAELIAELSD